MERKVEITQELLDSFLEEAVEDLRKSGLSKKEISTIIKDQFGSRYLSKFFEI